jgi:glycosyltransferase involved in cell wall biosynthesis
MDLELSIVIPVFNRWHFLPRALESILPQLKPGMELLVVDGGSAQGDMKPFVDHFGRGRAQYVRFESPLSCGANWNRAVRQAAGKWIHLFHDDDYVLDGFYETILQTPERCKIAATGFVNINDAGEIVFTSQYRGRGRFDPSALRNTNPFNPIAVVIQREIYDKIGGYREDLQYADWEFYYRASRRFDWWIDSRMLAAYREHASTEDYKKYAPAALEAIAEAVAEYEGNFAGVA